MGWLLRGRLVGEGKGLNGVGEIIGGSLFDVAAVYVTGSVAKAVGGVLGLKAPGVKALDVKAPEIKALEVNRIPDEANVVRGGLNTIESIEKGTGTHPSGVTGISVECGTCSVAELSKNLPHNKVGVTTAKAVREAGGDVIKTSGRSVNHATLTGLSSKVASALLEVIPNPNKSN